MVDQKQTELWLLNARTHQSRRLAAFSNEWITDVLVEPYSFKTGQHGSKAIVLTKNDSFESKFYIIDSQTAVSRLVATAPFNTSNLQLLPSETGPSAVIYVRESASEAPDLWNDSLGSGTTERLTHLNPAFDAIAFGKAQLMSYQGPHGEKLRAGILFPPSYHPGQRIPFVVVPYPGTSENSSSITEFEGAYFPLDGQLYSTRGYGVLFPDSPVRSRATVMEDIATTELAGVDEIIRLGYADPERIGVMGHSYGGYNVYALIAQTTRFHAAVEWSGFADRIAYYLSLEKNGGAGGIGQNETRSLGPGGTLWENRESYIRNSPLYFFDRVTTPLLIIEGTDDGYNGANSAKMAFTALRRLGKDVQLAMYDGESHVPQAWTDANRIDAFERITSWFDRFLCPNRISPISCVR